MRDSDDDPAAAPNYTQACIVMFGVNLVWVLFVLWALWGLVAVGVTGWAVNRVIHRIGAARRRA